MVADQKDGSITRSCMTRNKLANSHSCINIQNSSICTRTVDTLSVTKVLALVLQEEHGLHLPVGTCAIETNSKKNQRIENKQVKGKRNLDEPRDLPINPKGSKCECDLSSVYIKYRRRRSGTAKRVINMAFQYNLCRIQYTCAFCI